MFKLSATFLILLIVPFTFCSTEYLEMIQKTPEGKEILDTLLIQSKLLGANLDVGAVRAVLTTFQKGDASARNATAEINARFTQECEHSKAALIANLDESRSKAHVLERHNNAATRNLKRNDLKVERAQEEYDNYVKFQGIMKINKDSWTDFYSKVSENYKIIQGLLQQIGSALRHLNRAGENTAFVELPADYHTTLNQVKIQIVGDFDSVEELKPILTNMLEVMADSKAVQKPSVRGVLRRLFDEVSERFRDRVEQLEDENEFQVSMFDNFEKSFIANAANAKKTLDIVVKAKDKLAKKTEQIGQAITIAASITQKAENILSLKVNECLFFEEGKKHFSIKKNKVRSIISALTDIVNNRFPVLHSFIQKSQTELKQ